ncbi:GH3 auxin-responsive promoter [Pisolithus marmoratus]|nr:GH3 auxin-responsive promoter [Pisolithus marmoratus]
MSAVDEFPPQPISVLTAELVESLKERAQEVLSYLVKTNSITKYFNDAASLSGFRNVLGLTTQGQLDSDLLSKPDELFGAYHDTVSLTEYSDYRPFVSRFFEEPCKKSAVENLMAPGMPFFIVHSTGTSGGSLKCYPKYRHPEHMSTSTSHVMKASNPVSKNGGKNCIVYSLLGRQMVTALDTDGQVDRRMLVCLMSTGTVRMFNDMIVDRDPFYQTLKLPNNSSPLAVSYIPNYRSMLLVHALFAVQERQLELINTMFTTVLRDFCHTIGNNWDTILDCIESGKIPDLEGIDHVRESLERYFKADPKRTAELRTLDTKAPGWFTKVWPDLHTVFAISSGPFVMPVPEIRKYIGPDIPLNTLGINCSEAFLALPYDQRDPSLYKVVGSDEIIEFLPEDAPEESQYVTQTWKVEVGKRYEVILTTRDGLWRFRLNDIVEVVGFDPCDGQPIIHYVQRRDGGFRVANETTTEDQLCQVVLSASESLGNVSEFCAAADYRKTVPRYAFFVELQGDISTSASSAVAQIQAALFEQNDNYRREALAGKIGTPVIRVVRQGTFGEYREWKVRKDNIAAGQIKVPTVVFNHEVLEFLEERVIEEFS